MRSAAFLPESAAAVAQRMKRAVVYLRVSTAKQAGRAAEDIEGYSLPAQREACLRKAAELGAEVIAEYVDRGESAKTAHRPQFQIMLARIQRERNVAYVICDKLDRFARNRRDDANLLYDLRLAGAQLVSVKENIDETPAGQLLHAIMAGIAEFYSQNLGAEALKGMTQKARIGGTPGRAPVGYLNVPRRVDGREVRTVVVDPERAPIVQWAFEAYASGEWSVANLTDALRERGFQAFPTPKQGVRPIQRSRVFHMLTNPYYMGVVRFAGQVFPNGRHQPLITRETFETVQEILASHRAGERRRLHLHYLKSTLWCANCGSRLSFQRAHGHGGVYDYFFCGGRHKKRTDCRLPYLPVDEVERAVEEHWRRQRAQLRESFAERARSRLTAELERQRQLAAPELAFAHKRVEELSSERRRLAREVVRGTFPADLAAEEHDRIQRELDEANRMLATSELVFGKIERDLETALRFLGKTYEIYVNGGPHVRRLANQVFFGRLLVGEGPRVYGQPLEPFRGLSVLGSEGAPSMNEPAPVHGELALAGVSSGQGSYNVELAGERGFEPLIG